MNPNRHRRVPAALRRAARVFRALPGVDMVWLAVREPRSHAAVIRWAEGARADTGVGHRIEAGTGVGGAILLGGPPWLARLGAEADPLGAEERALLGQEGLTA